MPEVRKRPLLAPAFVLLLASACGSGGGSNGPVPGNNANSAAPAQGSNMVQNAAQPPADDAATADIPVDPGLAAMAPSRRRAYQRGYRDCSAGRYDPEPYPESYRIGCAAAEDRKADRRPQG